MNSLDLTETDEDNVFGICINQYSEEDPKPMITGSNCDVFCKENNDHGGSCLEEKEGKIVQVLVEARFNYNTRCNKVLSCIRLKKSLIDLPLIILSPEKEFFYS